MEHHKRYGNYLLLAGKHNDDHVHLGRESLVTMTVIRIAVMTTVFMRRHANRLERLRLRKGLPSHIHTHTHMCAHISSWIWEYY